ncbi:hypothetical protein Pst134EA_009742 [Puccinia striiformis f. sp. tritici]|uniref:hypothetical protein n=1 Tax=Puccinia striiformis f. sp. tritici TaxID=168172 RepID=UPI0020078FA9|nr:hypothetical protein Pst134EA_009742 [Puccinia striiformis f. sp. tritici]KAH9469214.1 hypothetical protein Pst134EA_009742 [Puccinia striiformis f. sp. tritici]KAI9621028.1 hypothetical protein KEM48_007875 [Puccinia striiformis f. sp. tritici PST-130]
MQFDGLNAFVWFPLLLAPVAAVVPLPQEEITRGIAAERTTLQLPRNPSAASSSQASYEGDLGTLIHRKANLVLDTFLDSVAKMYPHRADDIAGWNRLSDLSLRLSGEYMQMKEHPAFDMIGMAFSYRALYLRKATKSEQNDMDMIFTPQTQPHEILGTISKIDRLCTAAFPTGGAAITTREDILEATKIFRRTFEISFNIRFSEEIEQMSSKHKSPEWITPSAIIQNFHQKLTELEQWNQKTQILKLHKKLDRALGDVSFYRWYSPETQQPNLDWDLKDLLVKVHLKLDKMIDEYNSLLAFHPEISYQPIEELTEKDLMIQLITKLAELPERSSVLRFVRPHRQTYRPPLEERDQKTLVLMADSALVSALRNLVLLRRDWSEFNLRRYSSNCCGWLCDLIHQFGV